MKIIRIMNLLPSIFMVCLLSAFGTLVFAESEIMYRTGLEAKKGWFAVSPDGRQLVLATDQRKHGLRLLDLRSGAVTVIPEVEGRYFGFPSWSPDGKQLAVVSLQVTNNHYSLDGMEIELIDVGTWKRESIAAGDGVKGSPFFSADGKTVYYSKGKKRESGKTPASHLDLYGIELASGRETQLTFEKYYQFGTGDDDATSVLFSATSPDKDAFGVTTRNALIRYDKATKLLSLINIDQSSGIFDFYQPIRDRMGNLYFIAAKEKPRGGNYLWFLIRANSAGRQIEIIDSLLISMPFSIAKKTGEIYVMDKIKNELIIRRLPTRAEY